MDPLKMYEPCGTWEYSSQPCQFTGVYILWCQITFPETKSSHLKIGHPKRKRSYSNHPFSFDSWHENAKCNWFARCWRNIGRGPLGLLKSTWRIYCGMQFEQWIRMMNIKPPAVESWEEGVVLPANDWVVEFPGQCPSSNFVSIALLKPTPSNPKVFGKPPQRISWFHRRHPKKCQEGSIPPYGCLKGFVGTVSQMPPLILRDSNRHISCWACEAARLLPDTHIPNWTWTAHPLSTAASGELRLNVCLRPLVTTSVKPPNDWWPQAQLGETK